jgi:hypothetical protein
LTQSFQDWLNQVLKHLQPEGKVDVQHLTSTERVMKGHDAVAANWYDGLGLGVGDWEGKRPIKHTVGCSFELRATESNSHLHFTLNDSVSETSVLSNADQGSGQDCRTSSSKP